MIGSARIVSFLTFLGLSIIANFPGHNVSDPPYPIISMLEVIWIAFPISAYVVHTLRPSRTMVEYEIVEFASGLIPISLMLYFSIQKTIVAIFPSSVLEYTIGLALLAIIVFTALSYVNSRELHAAVKKVKVQSNSTWLVEFWRELTDRRSARDKRIERIVQIVGSLSPIGYALVINWMRNTDYSLTVSFEFVALQLIFMFCLIGSTQAAARLIVAIKIQPHSKR